MNKFFRNIAFVITVVLFFSCGKPLPTELVNDTSINDQGIQIETASPEPSTFVYSNGYDSTGIIQPVTDKSAVINVSGIRNSIGNQSTMISNYTADFFDKSLSIRNSHGRLVGYQTRMPGTVWFDNIPANKVPLRMRYMDNGIMVDTLLGFHFELRGSSMTHTHGLSDFPYDSKINFRLGGQMGNHVEFDIPTPQQIIGHLNLQGTRAKKNLRVEINWNGINSGKIYIVIGIFDPVKRDIFPYYKVTTADDGSVNLPANLFEQLPLQNQQQVVVTLIRRIEIQFQNNQLLKDNLIVSQSIHNIRVQLPN